MTINHASINTKRLNSLQASSVLSTSSWHWGLRKLLHNVLKKKISITFFSSSRVKSIMKYRQKFSSYYWFTNSITNHSYKLIEITKSDFFNYFAKFSNIIFRIILSLNTKFNEYNLLANLAVRKWCARII